MYQLQYLESVIERRPDAYAKELRHALFIAYNIDVNETTITRTLQRRGFTRKKVGTDKII